MKILLKLFSEANKIGKWNHETTRQKLFQLLEHAESKSIVIWHAGKNLPFEDTFEDYITDRLSINWGGYGSGVSLDNTYDYFKYQYAGDKVVEGKLKSNVTSAKGLFTDVEAFFEEGVDGELIDMFKAQNGKIVKKPGKKTCLFVANKGKRIVSHDAGTYPFFTVNKEMFKSLFPVEKERKEAVIREKKKSFGENYTAEEKEESLGSDRTKFSALKKLLSSGDKDKIDSGLMLLSSLGDAYLTDLILEGVSIKNADNSILEITGTFKGTLKLQPYHNYAITGILYHAPENAIYCNGLKSTLTGLSIDVVDPSWLNAFVNLESLQLSDSAGQITSLEKLSPSLQIKSLRLNNCAALSDISRIADFPISDFTFSECPKIVSIQALAGKSDNTGVKKVSFKDMEHLTTMDGVEFYRQLENVDLSFCYDLTDAKALVKCPALKKVETYGLESCVSIDGLIGSEETSLNVSIKSWSDPTIGSSKIDSIYISCSGMSDLNWLSLFPNTTSLEIDCEGLLDINGLKFLPGLKELTLRKGLFKSLAPISELHLLETLSIDECHQIIDTDEIKKLDNLNNFDISDSENLEDFSGWMCNKNRKFDSYLRLYNLKKLKHFGDMLHIGDLTEIELHNSFNQQLLADIASAPSVSILQISQDEVRIGSTLPLKMMMHISDAKVLELKQTSIEKLKLKQCSIKNLNGLIDVKGLKYLSIVGCAAFESLTGTGDFPDVEILELVKLPKLKSLKGLDRFPKLKRIKLHGLNLIVDVSPLAILTDLVEVDFLDCYNIEVEAKPKGQMTRTQTIKYLIKIAEHYKLKSINEWKSKLDEEPVAGPPLPIKTIQKIKKLLQSRDIKEIKSGVSMAMESNNLALFEELLQGVEYSEKTLKPNKIFSGSGPAQPFLNMAMTGILSAASSANPHWKSFCENINDLQIDLPSIDYLNCFQNLKRIELTQVTELSIHLRLPFLESFHIKSWGWGNSRITEKVNFSQFENCQALKSIKLDTEITAENLTGLGKLKYLEELCFHDINGLKIQDLSELSTCKNLKILEIIMRHAGNVKQRNKINALDGIDNLKNLAEIALQNAEINNTKALSGMSWLKKISIQENDSLTEFTPPFHAEKLEDLNLSDCPNLSIIGNSDFPSNLSFDIENTGFLGFPELKGVNSFSYLNIGYCKLMENLNGFEKIIAVEDDNKIKLTECVKLKNLNGISHLKEVHLTIDTAELPDVKIPNGIKSLRASELKSLEGIANFSELVKLDISSSKVSKLNLLEGLKNLKVLNLAKIDKLKSLKGLESLVSLEQLILFDLENLEDISALENLQLQSIYIRGCKKKKSDFPLRLQSIIDWQSSYVSG